MPVAPQGFDTSHPPLLQENDAGRRLLNSDGIVFTANRVGTKGEKKSRKDQVFFCVLFYTYDYLC